jgi:hypothetical protein
MTCPECGTKMRQTRRGSTLKKRGGAWVCPQAEAEVVRDERGHLRRKSEARHAYVRAWQEHELEVLV